MHSTRAVPVRGTAGTVLPRQRPAPLQLLPWQEPLGSLPAPRSLSVLLPICWIISAFNYLPRAAWAAVQRQLLLN